MLNTGPQLTVVFFDSVCADSAYVNGGNLTNFSSYKEMTSERGKLKAREEKGHCCVYKAGKSDLSYINM